VKKMSALSPTQMVCGSIRTFVIRGADGEESEPPLQPRIKEITIKQSAFFIGLKFNTWK
jgi:hypothetical protein